MREHSTLSKYFFACPHYVNFLLLFAIFPSHTFRKIFVVVVNLGETFPLSLDDLLINVNEVMAHILSAFILSLDAA